MPGAPPESPHDGETRSWVERAPLQLSGGVVDFARCRFVRHGGKVEPLSPREAEMLAFLADRANRTVPREDLLTHVWGHSDQSLSRAVDTAVSRLRRKLEADPSTPQMLFTEHGLGYRLLVDAPPEPSQAAKPPPARRLLRLTDRVADLTAGYVEHGDQRIALTAQERLLLEELLRVGGAALAGQAIARRLEMSGEGALRNAVFRLRAKLEVDPGEPRHLLSVPGGCYRLEARIDAPTTTRRAYLAALVSLTEYVGAVLGFPDCVVYVHEHDRLTQVAAFGPKRGPDGAVRVPLRQALGEGLVGLAAQQRDAVLCPDTASESRYLRDLEPARSELAVPVVADGHVVGVLDLEHPALAAFTDAHRTALLTLTAVAAPAFSRLVGGSHV